MKLRSKIINCPLTFIIAILLLIRCNIMYGQIGVNTTDPHPMSVLDIQGNGDKGLLIPFVNRTNRKAMTVLPVKKGMLVCDTVDYTIYMYTGSDWKCLSPFWFTKDYANNSNLIADEAILNGMNVGIGLNNPGAKLHVNGTSRFDGNSITNGQNTINGNQVISINSFIQGNQSVTGNQIISNNSNIGGTQIVSGSQTILNNSSIEGSQTINGALFVYKDAKIAGDLNVTDKIIGNGSKVSNVNADMLDGHHESYFASSDSVGISIQNLKDTKLDASLFQNQYTLNVFTAGDSIFDSLYVVSHNVQYSKIEGMVFVSGKVIVKTKFDNRAPEFQTDLPFSAKQIVFTGFAKGISSEQNQSSSFFDPMPVTFVQSQGSISYTARAYFLRKSTYCIYFNFFYYL